MPTAERRGIAAQLLDTATYRHEHGITRHATLDDPDEFRGWLASLPPEEPLPGEWDDPLEAFLRAHGDPTACLVEVGDEGWQHYRSGGVEDEIPSWAFYLLGWWTDTTTARGTLANFTAYWADWEAHR